MGSLQAAEMAEMLEIDSAIAWHLQSNHFPPVPVSMVEVCIKAIRLVNEDVGNFVGWHTTIPLPKGVTYLGETVAPAWAIIEQHHLDPWITLDEEGLED
jgi:hypothetical protein